MKNKILQELHQLAEQHDVRILYACEAGSRAWGFASTDSDYDVRFIYAHKLPWYLTVNKQNDTINPPADPVYDFAGWELRKVLCLVKQSNASIFEWLQSPIIYYMDQNFKDKLWAVMQNYFSPIAVIHHYLSLVNKALDAIRDNKDAKIKIKSLFYGIRSLLVAMWINEKQTIPPIMLDELKPVVTDADIISSIDDLLATKQAATEAAMTQVAKNLYEFIFSQLKLVEANAKNMPACREKTDALNNLLYETVMHEHKEA